MHQKITPVKEGTLKIQTKVRKLWREKYFSFENKENLLKYHKDRTSNFFRVSPQGKIHLDGAFLLDADDVDIPEPEKTFYIVESFAIEGGSFSIPVVADSPSSKRNWMGSIAARILGTTDVQNSDLINSLHHLIRNEANLAAQVKLGLSDDIRALCWEFMATHDAKVCLELRTECT